MEDLIKALQIFLKYGNKNYPTFCEHDILYVDVDPSVVSDEDKKVLDELGFFVDDENDCFASFKYGSM
ncbi:hypothetical protein [Phocaeicola vulgatus]|jgi:hypothetical protein|uniref:hypothetical protein n=1 Tax=Phocaeicola vulgatus TaxID=821 RepID=UPI00189BED61|nr:hypothetical protein [Phocaeicola vulgatus]